MQGEGEPARRGACWREAESERWKSLVKSRISKRLCTDFACCMHHGFCSLPRTGSACLREFWESCSVPACEGNRRSMRPVKGTSRSRSRRAMLALDRPTRRFGDGYDNDGVEWLC